MSTDSVLLREVTIKTGVVKRLVKEYSYYVKEAENEANKLQALKAQDGVDEYIIKKQAEIHQDSLQMIPECSRRVQNSVSELKKLLENNATALENTPQYEAAREQIIAVDNLKL